MYLPYTYGFIISYYGQHGCDSIPLHVPAFCSMTVLDEPVLAANVDKLAKAKWGNDGASFPDAGGDV